MQGSGSATSQKIALGMAPATLPLVVSVVPPSGVAASTISGLDVALGVAGGAAGACLVAAFAGELAELFQGSIVDNVIVNSDPGLRAEKSWTGELTAERTNMRWLPPHPALGFECPKSSASPSPSSPESSDRRVHARESR